MPKHLFTLFIALTLNGCGTTPALPSVAAPPTAAPTAFTTPEPSLAPSAAPTPQPGDRAADLAATVAAQLAPTLSDGSAGMAVVVIALERGAAEQPLWAAFSTGTAREASHFVAIYARAASGWQELSRITLDNPSSIAPDAIRQVPFGPPEVWLAVRGSSGLVGPCCYDLLRFEGTTLHNELSVAERTLERVELRARSSGLLEVTITVRPWTGAGGDPAPEKVTTYRWNGQRMVPQ